uniref:GAG-pre-integrase domain-containing protein n=1 Tax=Amphimedon queenslandica TaxID=400682 RepID=A0A1X7VFZ3_AMPQE
MKTVIERLTHEEKKLQDRAKQSSTDGELWQLNTSRGEVQDVISVRNLDTFNATAENEKDQGRALSSMRSIPQKGESRIIKQTVLKHVKWVKDHLLKRILNAVEVGSLTLELPVIYAMIASCSSTLSSKKAIGSRTRRWIQAISCCSGYSEELSFNLLSVSKAVERGNSVQFGKSSCIIRDPNHRPIAVAEKIGLYQVNTTPVYVNSATSCQETTKEDIWHDRFGHLNVRIVQKLAKENLVCDFDFTPTNEIQFCESCLDGKPHRSAFPSHSETRAKEPLELVHSDICGKVNSKTLSGAEYLLTFINDFTRYVWIYVLKQKSEAFEKFRVESIGKTGNWKNAKGVSK